MANSAIALSPVKLLGAFVIGVGVCVAYLYAGSVSAASTRAMCMQCQGSESADATKWVKNGMYRLEGVTLSMEDEVREADPDSLRKMTRIKPLVLGADENDALVQECVNAIGDMGAFAPDSIVLEQQWPNLTRRARYAYSLFIAEDQPMDFYKVYVRVGRNQYVLVIGRDVESGEFKMRAGEWRLINEYGRPGSPEELAQFKKVEAAAER